MGLSGGMILVVFCVGLLFFAERFWLKVGSGLCLAVVLIIKLRSSALTRDWTELMIFVAAIASLILIAAAVRRTVKGWP